MRSRLAVAFVVLGILLIGCFAGVRAVELRDLVRGIEAQHVAEQADQVAAAVVLVEQSGGTLDAPALRRLLPPATRGEVDPGAEATVTASATGYDARGGAGQLAGRGSSGSVRVTLWRSDAAVDEAWRSTLGPVAALAISLVVLAGLLGWGLATLLARPFRRLAVAAGDLARGRFDLDLPDSRVPEVRAVSDALERSSARLRQRMVRDQAFLSDSSHRLRTPVTGMRLELEELQLRDGLDADVRGTVDRSVRALDRLEQLLTGFFSLASAGRRETDVTRVTRTAAAAGLESHWQQRLGRRTTLRVLTEGDPDALLAPGPLEMVLDPVLADLRRASPSRVELVLGGAGDQVSVRVRAEGADTGLEGRERATRPGMVAVRERAELLGGRCAGDAVDGGLRLWLGPL